MFSSDLNCSCSEWIDSIATQLRADSEITEATVVEADNHISKTGSALSLTFDTNSVKSGKFSECVRVWVKGKAYILKRSMVKEMTQRSKQKWTRDIASFEAEACFYNIVSKKESEGSSSEYNGTLCTGPALLWPHLVFGGCNIQEYKKQELDEVENSTRDYRPPDSVWFAYLLEDLEASGYAQCPDLSLDLLSDVLGDLARFHLSTTRMFTSSSSNAISCRIWSNGTFWAIDKIEDLSKEIDGIPARYSALYDNFRDVFSSGKDKMDSSSSILNGITINENLGSRLHRHLGTISDIVHKALPKKCIVHGDSKVANIFMKEMNSSGERHFRWIDFQWLGWGHALFDVVYQIVSSLEEVEVLQKSEDIKIILGIYLRINDLTKTDVRVSSESVESISLAHSSNTLDNESDNHPVTASKIKVPTPLGSSSAASTETLDLVYLEWIFKLIFLDYARVVFGYMWDGSITKEVLVSRSPKINMCLHNRSYKHFLWFVKMTQLFLDDLGLD